jgi:hypothetical protein
MLPRSSFGQTGLSVQNAFFVDSERKDFRCRMPAFCAEGTLGATPIYVCRRDLWCNACNTTETVLYQESPGSRALL